MKQINTVKFISEDNKMMIVCDADTNVGILHDFLLEIKGNIVEKISTAQKQEIEATEKVKEADELKKAEAEKEVDISEEIK